MNDERQANRPDAYLARIAATCAMLERLQRLADDHFGHDPDAINWGHVGDLGPVEAGLDELLAIFGGDGELVTRPGRVEHLRADGKRNAKQTEQ